MNISSNVLVRAYGDEPVPLKALPHDGDLVVFRDSPEAGIPYPRAFVYEWDEGLFAELRSAFELNDLAKLIQLWSRARFFIGTETAH